MNVVHLIGRLGKDPELRATQNGTAVCNFSLATTERYIGADGEKHEETEWFSVVAWKKLAEILAKYLKKGFQVQITGKLKTRKWDDSDGNPRQKTEVIVTSFNFLQNERKENENNQSQEPFVEDDLPF